MKILFLGSGTLACPPLRLLLERPRDEVTAVVTRPERPKGRHLKMAPCPLKAFADRAGVSVLTPDKPNDPEVVARLAADRPDVLVVVAYGKFLKADLLAVPRLGALNIHPSLLPRYRGAAPIQWAVASGDAKTGVSILYVTEQMDAGDILAQETTPIEEDDTAVTLEARLAETGAVLLGRVLDRLAAGDTAGRKQNEDEVVFAPKLTKEDGRIDWSLSARAIRNQVRGFQPWPGAFCEAPEGSGRMLALHAVRLEAGEGSPGQILSEDRDGLLVATGGGALRLLQVQPAGRVLMSGGDFCRGFRWRPGDRLG